MPGRTEYDDGKWRHPVAVKPGEVVLFGAFAGTEVGEDLLLLKESELLAVLEPARSGLAEEFQKLGVHPQEPRACPTCKQPPPGFEYVGQVVSRS